MLPPLQILLVEDNRINQLVAQRLLEKAGHRVTIADNGKVAVQAITDSKFDLVLMDVSMPEMDGLEATQMIRQREQGSDVRLPIVAFTANAMKGDREKCLEAGMDAYVTKPVQPPDLFQAMADALDTARRAC
jgi:two-component system sensor histidine kinase/response regulator